MASRKFRRIGRSSSSLTPRVYGALTSGFDLGRVFSPIVMMVEMPADATAGVRDAWEEHRDAIMERWIAEHPGRRPWGWWKHDAPEEKAWPEAAELDQLRRLGVLEAGEYERAVEAAEQWKRERAATSAEVN